MHARTYRSRSAAERDAWNEARQERAQATRAANRMARPVEPRELSREPGRINIDLAGVRIDWVLLPARRNIRQWRAVTQDLRPVLIDGRPLIGGKDEIGRAALRMIPSYHGLRHLIG